MPRRSAASIKISPNLRCLRVYPVQGIHKAVRDLKTIGFKLTREQATEMARVLLAVTQEWSEIDVTVFRTKERSDGTFPITVTSTP